MKDFNQVSEKLEALLREKGAGEYEYRLAESEKRELNTEKADVNLYRTVFDNALALTVILDGRKGTAAGSDLEDEGLRKAVEDAVLGAEASIPDEANGVAEKQENKVFRTGPWEPDMDGLFDRLRELTDTVEKDYPRVNLMQLIAEHDRTRVLYANSSGTRFEHFKGAYKVLVEMSGSDGEINTGLDYTEFTTHSLDEPLLSQGSFRQHMQDVEASLNRVELPGKFEGTVIFTPECLGYFFYMLASNYLMGEGVLNGTSQWLNKLDQQVASEKISITLKADDERIVELQPFTDDGYTAEDVTVIDKGVLKSFLLSLYVARKTGRPVTKNSSFALVMEPGDTPLAEIIASVDKGLIVGGFSGGEPGANGEFSGVAKNSFYVEKGKIVGAVTETMINGNLEKLLQNVAAVSREQVCDGSMVLPWLASTGVVISGK